MCEGCLGEVSYATFTATGTACIAEDMRQFVDRLQRLDENLPLRTVPLEIRVFTPVAARRAPGADEALVNQRAAIEAWQDELGRRFSSADRARRISDVPLRSIRRTT
jgi:hypothetical protein